MLRSAQTRSTAASRLRIALAIVLAIVAVRVVVRRFDQYAWRYDRADFAIFFDWGTRYRVGADVWAENLKGLLPSGKPLHICNHTPAFIEAFAPLTLLDKPLAHSIWIIAQLVFLVLALWLVAREIDPPLDAASVVILIAVALMFRSVRFLILSSFYIPMLLLPMVISWKCARRDRPAAAGLTLAIATLLKLYPGALAGYFLLRKQWSLLWWTAGFFLAGVAATGIANWRKLLLSREYTTSQVAYLSMDHTALLPSVYAWCASLAKGGAPSWIAVIAVTAILDAGIMAVLFWATFRAANDSISDGLVFGLWLIAMVLVAPLAWRAELVLLFPAYIFASVTVWRVSIEGRAFNGVGFVAGAILIGICAAVELFKALPDFQPQTLTALLTFVGTALILRSWTDTELPIRSGFRPALGESQPSRLPESISR